MQRMYLAEWARCQSPPVPYSTARRWFNKGVLRDKGVNAHRSPSGSILVDFDASSPVDAIDPEALVRRLQEAGYVVLTQDQMRRIDEALLRVDRDPQEAST